MKVYIGPYVKHYTSFGLQQRWLCWNHKTENYWEVEEKDYTKLDWFVETMCDMVDKTFLKPINKFNERKGRNVKVRIDNYDLWNTDHTLALVILPILKKVKEEKHSTAGTDREDAPDGPEYEDDTADHEPSGYSSKRWDYVLDEMIFAFEKITDEDWDLEIYVRHGKQWTDEAMDESNAIRDRISNGLRLFGKYYQSLWT